MKPTYIHDCPACRFVACTFGNRGELTDWYVCTGRESSVIGRHSDEGPDYWSMPASMVKDDRYLIASLGSTQIRGQSEQFLIARQILSQFKPEA